MGSDRDSQVLQKLVAHIDRVLEYCKDVRFEDFLKNRMLQEACVFNILQIGELARNGLSEGLTAAHPQIPWHQMYGLRNRIVHDYEGVQLKIIWDTITQDFKPLSDDLKGIMGSHAQKH